MDKNTKLTLDEFIDMRKAELDKFRLEYLTKKFHYTNTKLPARQSIVAWNKECAQANFQRGS